MGNALRVFQGLDPLITEPMYQGQNPDFMADYIFCNTLNVKGLFIAQNASIDNNFPIGNNNCLINYGGLLVTTSKDGSSFDQASFQMRPALSSGYGGALFEMDLYGGIPYPPQEAGFQMKLTSSGMEMITFNQAPRSPLPIMLEINSDPWLTIWPAGTWNAQDNGVIECIRPLAGSRSSGQNIDMVNRNSANSLRLNLYSFLTNYGGNFEEIQIDTGSGGVFPPTIKWLNGGTGVARRIVFIGDMVNRTKAGVPVDGDFQYNANDGTVVVDTTDNRLYVRTNGAWRYATLT